MQRLFGKKIFITGADGFIGSHLTEALVREGAEVTALAYYNSFNSWGWLDSVAPNVLKNINVVLGDVRDPNLMRELVKKKDIVFHLAALIGIPFSYVAPDLYIDTNVKGTLNILQAAKESEVERILITSTSEVYGTAQTVPISESHPLQGQSPYSASKIGADKIGESFYLSFNSPVVTVRPFNTYGPRQSTRAVIPTIITQALAGQKEIRLGALDPTRDLVFVSDTAEGFIQLALSPNSIGKSVNISTGNEISVGNLAKLILKQSGSDAKIVEESNRLRPKGSEVERLLGDNSLLYNMTSWMPKTDLETGLLQTINWFKDPKNLSLYKIGSYVV